MSVQKQYKIRPFYKNHLSILETTQEPKMLSIQNKIPWFYLNYLHKSQYDALFSSIWCWKYQYVTILYFVNKSYKAVIPPRHAQSKETHIHMLFNNNMAIVKRLISEN